MVVDVKFCGLTRREDVARAAALGARYAGVILADSPRRVTVSAAHDLLAGLPRAVRRVGVFGRNDTGSLGDVAEALALDVVQLHADPTAAEVERLRGVFGGTVWGALRLESSSLPGHAEELFASADGVVLDARSPRQLGGTGERFDWGGASLAIQDIRGETTLILAGGLRAENVAEGVRLIRPNVVDVSSGVESSPGIKDHDRMRAFVDALLIEAGRRREGK